MKRRNYKRPFGALQAWYTSARVSLIVTDSLPSPVRLSLYSPYWLSMSVVHGLVPLSNLGDQSEE